MKRYLGLPLSAVLVALSLSSNTLTVWSQPPGAQLSTNITLVNLGSVEANAVIEARRSVQTGQSLWDTRTFTVAANGGQVILFPTGSNPFPGTIGVGSAVVSADQPLAGVVQIRALNQNPTTNGAYSAISQGDSLFFVPLVAKNLNTASGLANSEIVVQNLGSVSTTAVITLVPAPGTSFTQIVHTSPLIAPGASYYYTPIGDSSVSSPWYGSAVVRGVSATIGVVANFFAGNTMQTFSAFPGNAPTTQWFIPLFAYKLSNGLSTPIVVQNLNLSGSTINTGTLSLYCQPGSGSPGSPFTSTNVIQIPHTAAYFFNPVTDSGFSVSVPNGFFGACTLTALANVVVLVQARFVTGNPLTEEAAAYEAFPFGSTQQTLFVPLVAKRLTNGFATALTVQNLDLNATANYTATYVRSALSNVGSSSYVITGTIPAGGAFIHNLRLAVGGVPAPMPDGWFGTVKVEANKPIAGFVQLTFLKSINPGLPNGDNFMAHNAFLQ
ncbi:MAG: hypothetical protein RML84_06025 [Anaerolineae bacterium]|nr:hypothetical protein [Anaerolineae bacterium]